MPGELFRIRPEIIDVGPKSAPKPDEAKPKMAEAKPTNKHKPIPIDFGSGSWCRGVSIRIQNFLLRDNSDEFGLGLFTVRSHTRFRAQPGCEKTPIEIP